jgi:hypothetical protein
MLRLLKSLQWYSGRKSWKSEKKIVKTIQEPKKISFNSVLLNRRTFPSTELITNVLHVNNVKQRGFCTELITNVLHVNNLKQRGFSFPYRKL